MPAGERRSPRVALWALACALAIAPLAWSQNAPQPLTPSQTLYKLVDKSGKVTYVDHVPKGFDGEVTRIEVDPQANTQRPTPAPVPSGAPTGAPAKPDLNTTRRALRERLQADIDRARVKVADARKALSDGVDPKDNEYQTIQQKFDASRAREGESGPRPNCRKQAGSNGMAIWICPTIVPGEMYRDRQQALEEAVKAAEAELEIAERTYRRSVD